MALIRRHWKLAVLNALLVVSTIIAVIWYVERSGIPAARAATAGAQAPASAGGSVTPLDTTTYSRIFQLRNALCLTPIDLAAMGCSQNQTSSILSSLLNWYQSNASAWDSNVQQIQSANQQLNQAHQAITGAGTPALWQQMAAANAQIDDANTSLAQLMQTAVAVVTPQLTADQQSLWNTVQANVTNGVPAQFRYAPNVSPAQAEALLIAVSKHRANVVSLLNSQQQQVLQSVVLVETQNAKAVFSTDLSALPLPTVWAANVPTTAPAVQNNP